MSDAKRKSARSKTSGEAGYAHVPLAKKLGIKSGMTVTLIGAPPGFAKSLGKLPAGAVLKKAAALSPPLTLWFAQSETELQSRIAAFARAIGDGHLWIANRKGKAAGAQGPTQNSVRAAGLSRGLVDFKACSMDAIWSGLLFRKRKTKAA